MKSVVLAAIFAAIILSACNMPAPATPDGSADLTPTLAGPVPTEPGSMPPDPTLPAANPTDAPAITAAQAPQSITGIYLDPISEAGGLDLAAAAKAFWLRRDLVWESIEPAQGLRNWEAAAGFESELLNASSRGLQVIAILNNTPAWAVKPGFSCGAVAEGYFPALAAFITDAVARYSQPPFGVKYWEVWNEPDVIGFLGCWGDPTDPYFGGTYYGEMLKWVYPAIKSADPEAKVLVGGLLLNCDPDNPPEIQNQPGTYMDCTPSRFLEGILESGGGDFFDGVSFHAYDYYAGEYGKYGNLNWNSIWNTTGPVLIAKARFINNLLARYNLPEKILINTESALVCAGDGTEPACTTQDHELTKAYYIAQAFASAVSNGLSGNVWYSISGWRGSGLLDANMQPLPAYQAYSFSASQLQGMVFSSEVGQYEGVKGFELIHDNKRLWVLWSLDGNAHSIQLPSPPANIFSTFGEPLPVEQSLSVTVAPIYVEWLQ